MFLLVAVSAYQLLTFHIVVIERFIMFGTYRVPSFLTLQRSPATLRRWLGFDVGQRDKRVLFEVFEGFVSLCHGVTHVLCTVIRVSRVSRIHADSKKKT